MQGSTKLSQLENKINKKILNLPFYDIILIPFYLYKFEYHARLWLHHKKSNFLSLKNSAKSKSDDQVD